MVASVTSYWGDAGDQEIKAALPAHVPVSLSLVSDDEDGDESDESEAPAEPEVGGRTVDEVNADSADLQEVATNQAVGSQAEAGEGEEETQEMDALLEPGAEDDKEETG